MTPTILLDANFAILMVGGSIGPVADAVLLELGATGATLLTTDFRLFGAALKAGYRSVNFNHLRDGRPGFRN